MTKSVCRAEAVCEGRRWAQWFSIQAKWFRGSANSAKQSPLKTVCEQVRTTSLVVLEAA
jgi:hypothetical protein